MLDIEEATNNLVDEMQEWLDICPIGPNIVPADTLYELCQQYVVDKLASQNEERSDERKYEQFTNNG